MQLRAAREVFEGVGAEAFTQRTATELLAAGEPLGERVEYRRDHLTSQEQQVAQLALEGRSNAEIGAELFISTHTVAYHLRKVFLKLGITSRRQLVGSMPAPSELGAAAG